MQTNILDLCALVNCLMQQSRMGFELPGYSPEALRILCRTLVADAYEEYEEATYCEAATKAMYAAELRIAYAATEAKDDCI